MMNKQINLKLLLGLFFIVSLPSCSTLLKSSKITSLTTDYCKPQIRYNFEYEPEIPLHVYEQEETLRNKLSEKDYVLAKYIGLLPLLTKQTTTKDTLGKLLIRQQITDRILIVNTAINAVSAELDCNGERYGQLANFVANINNKNLRRATVASIAIGTVVAISTSLISDNKTNIGINIAGGAAAAGIGFLTLNPKGKKVALTFERSLIANIWNNDNKDKAFPSFLWEILQAKSFSNAGTISLAENIKQRWLQYSFDGEIDEKSNELFFKKGGEFTAEDLESISNMNNELQASIRTLEQDILNLLIVLNRLE